jgi:hypothetical protein
LVYYSPYAADIMLLNYALHLTNFCYLLNKGVHTQIKHSLQKWYPAYLRTYLICKMSTGYRPNSPRVPAFEALDDKPSMFMGNLDLANLTWNSDDLAKHPSISMIWL